MKLDIFTRLQYNLALRVVIRLAIISALTLVVGGIAAVVVAFKAR